MLKRRLHFDRKSNKIGDPPPPPPNHYLPPSFEATEGGAVPAVAAPIPAVEEPVAPPAPEEVSMEYAGDAAQLAQLSGTSDGVGAEIDTAAGAPATTTVKALAEKKKPSPEDLTTIDPGIKSRFDGVKPDNESQVERIPVYEADGRTLRGYTYEMRGPAAQYFEQTSPGVWKVKDGVTEDKITDEMILDLSNSTQGESVKSWPRGRQLLYFGEMDGEGDAVTRDRRAQAVWALDQRAYVDGTARNRTLPAYLKDDPTVVFKERLPNSDKRGEKGKAIQKLTANVSSGDLTEIELWNAAYNAPNLTPKQVLQALNADKSNKDATVNERISTGFHGTEAEDDGLGGPTDAASGARVVNPDLAETKQKEAADNIARPTVELLDGLTGDLEFARAEWDYQRESAAGPRDEPKFQAAKIRYEEAAKKYPGPDNSPDRTRARATYRQHEIAGEIKEKEATRTAQEERLSQLDRAGELVRRLHGPIPDIAGGTAAAADSVGIELDAKTRDEVEAEYKAVYDRFTDEQDRNALTTYHDAKPSLAARQTFAQYRKGVETDTVDKTKEEIGKLEAEDSGLEEKGHYKERRAKAEKGLAEFITWRDNYARAADAGDFDAMTKLNKQGGVNYEVKPTKVGTDHRNAYITSQNQLAETQRGTRNAKWEQTKKDLGRLNEGLTVGIDLLATGSDAIDAADKAKKAIDGILGNDGEMGAAFTTMQSTIIADATKLKSTSDVLDGLTALQTAAGGDDKEDPYGEGGSPAERLAKMLDQPRSQRFGNALGLNEQGEDSLNFGRSQEDIVAQNTEIASHTYEEKDNRYYVNEVQGGMKA